MRCEPLTGREALVASLRSKHSIARKRAEYGATRVVRAEQAAARDRYAAKLASLGETV